MINHSFNKLSKTKLMVLCSIFSSLAALFQVAGGLLPIVGYFISPLATAPIVIGTICSISFGFTSYMLTILLLFVLEPSELFVFPFTTGLLGLGIGLAFHFFEKRLSILISGAIVLTVGIVLLLFLFKFPILGPSSSNSFSFPVVGYIFLFTTFYSWIWVEISLTILRRIKIND